jgi:hypothetical protein
MRRTPFLIFVLGPFLAVAPALRAQTIPSPYHYVEKAQTLGIHAGYLWTERGKYDTNPTSGPLVELRYEGRFAGPVSAIASVDFLSSDRPVYTRAAGATTSVRLPDASSLVASAEAGFRLSITGPRTWHGLQPSVATTAGLVTNLAGRTDEEKQLPGDQLVRLGPAFAVSPSAGIDWFPTERISLDLRATDHIWRRTTPAGLTDSGTKETAWTNNVGVTVGAALHF